MAKRRTGVGKNKTSRSRKTKKRILAKVTKKKVKK
jgi:hypothetical protein